MLIHKHWVVGTGILVAGSLGAIPFQRHATDGEHTHQNLSVPIHQSIVQSFPFDPVEAAQPIPDDKLESPTRKLYQTESQQREREARAPLAPPTISLIPARPPEISDAYPQAADDERTSLQVARLNLSKIKPEILSVYTIQNGDTLTGIAEHFLGQANLADWIYHQNRELIPKPELLPIGVEIKIPAQPTPELFSHISSGTTSSKSKLGSEKQPPIRQPVPPAPIIPRDD
ncbi:MAG: hypothetical protein CMJ76_08515 [Planctomycetaceae bacterium]|nr:hypothetical protein [Planctomycetaceae bacterium]|tara:strand:+ start:785 stop:1474 length:690 start_codon:yes stop_codon:yes gene_type:complete